MATKGANLLLHDFASLTPPSSGRVLLAGDALTGVPSALLPDGSKLAWGNNALIAPTVKTDDFTIAGADNGATYDCQGAISVSLSAGVSAGVVIRIIQTRGSDVTTISNDGTSELISEFNNISPLFFQSQGKVITLYSLGNDQWYITGDGLNFGDLPLTIPGCSLWYDFADYLNTTDAVNDGDPITSITDKSDDGNDSTQLTATSQATINLSILNGLPSARFDGNDFYNIPGLINLTADNNTTFLVAWQITNSQSQAAIGGQSNAERFVLRNQGGKWRFVHGGNVNTPTSITTTTPRVMVATRESNQLRIFEGTTQVSSAGGGNSTTMTQFSLGSRGSLSNAWNGYISEVIIYRRNLSTSERDSIARYLLGKYDL